MAIAYECWFLEQADKLDHEEVRQGYHDGRHGEAKPAYPGNRTDAYVHGWHAGAHDAGRIPCPEWLRALAAQYVHDGRKH